MNCWAYFETADEELRSRCDPEYIAVCEIVAGIFYYMDEDVKAGLASLFYRHCDQSCRVSGKELRKIKAGRDRHARKKKTGLPVKEKELWDEVAYHDQKTIAGHMRLLADFQKMTGITNSGEAKEALKDALKKIDEVRKRLA